MQKLQMGKLRMAQPPEPSLSSKPAVWTCVSDISKKGNTYTLCFPDAPGFLWFILTGLNILEAQSTGSADISTKVYIGTRPR